jgi:hypothetical protein
MLKPMPWWLRAVSATGTWITIYPNIYHPVGIDPYQFPEVIAHESVHLGRQESTGVAWWLVKYFLSRKFRLDEEVLGFAAELKCHPENDRERFLVCYADMLSGSTYFWAAHSQADAEAALRAAIA